MNDAEIMNRWLGQTDSQALIGAIQRVPSERKLRLFAVACCRTIWHLLSDKRGRHAVTVAEEFADGRVGENVLSPAFHGVHYSIGKHDTPTIRAKSCALQAARAAAHPVPYHAAATAAQNAAEAISWSVWAQAVCEGATDDDYCKVRHAALLEQIASETSLFDEIDPRHASAAQNAWRTPAIVHLAQTIYDERSYGLLPMLGDALEDAGCTDAELVAHCRRPASHVRGCWALDSILDKT
jgi:hypothetical protein